MNQKRFSTDYTDDTVNMDYAPGPLLEKAPTAVSVIRHLSSYVKLGQNGIVSLLIKSCLKTGC